MSLKERFSDLKKYFFISPELKLELAQKNFSFFRYFNLGIIAFCILSEIAFLIICFVTKSFDLKRIFYFAILLVWCLLMMLVNQLIKNVESKNAHIYKNIPSYITFLVAVFYALFNFFEFNNPFTGYLVYLIVGTMSNILFNYEPVHQMMFLMFPLILMAPRLYEAFGAYSIIDVIMIYFISVSLCIGRRVLMVKNNILAQKQAKDLKAITFGNFTLLYKDNVLKFQRRKSLELLAYLIFKKGSSVNSQELMKVLWGDRATSSVYGANLRNSIVDIKHALKENNIENFFISEYNSFRINPYMLDCDFYNYVEGEAAAKKSYAGEFMNQFEWAQETISYLDKLQAK